MLNERHLGYKFELKRFPLRPLRILSVFAVNLTAKTLRILWVRKGLSSSDKFNLLERLFLYSETR